jgi:hypothetical protein
MDGEIHELYDDNRNVMEEKELETDIDCKQTPLVNDLNILKNRMGLPDTVTTVTNFKDIHVRSLSVVEQVADSDNNILNPRMGQKGSLYYCNEHPNVQNINKEEIEHPLRYSKEPFSIPLQ